MRIISGHFPKEPFASVHLTTSKSTSLSKRWPTINRKMELD